jgi:CheY-like chemotaxis protein
MVVPAEPESTGIPVLVADDDPDVRQMLRTLLELDGYEVMEARDGTEAWAAIEEHEPPVVIADVQMPGLTGLQICQKVRQSKYLCKVIVYTAGMATEAEAMAAGCDRYLLKTQPLPLLRQAVRDYLVSG